MRETRELDRINATTKAIKKAMIDKDIRRREDLASMIGMPLSTFNFKMRTGRFTVPEMASIFWTLDMSLEDAGIVLGVHK